MLWMAIWKSLCEWMALGLRKMAAFSAHVRQCKNEKNSYKPTVATLFYRTKTNVPQPFSNIACRCELAVQQSFSETSQSCASTTVTLSHRFKSSPAIPGKVAMPGVAGYMMNAGHFRENLVSSEDLNRSLGVQRAAALDLLETWSPCSRPFAILPVSAVSDAQKLATGNFLHVRACFCGTFCTPQKVTTRSLAGSFEVLQTSIQRTATAVSH